MGVRGCGITVRIIPAYAGSTDFRRAGSRLWPDHPRIRGEHALPPLRPASARGSSPHTRGARMETRRGQSQRRIIPAYAGSTPLRPPPSFPPRDHPRIRGEHRRWRVSSRPNPGSSPHTRGAQGFRYAHSTFCRIIPAYAGSTSCANGTSNTPADHPRIRGEHLGYRWDAEAKLGSSPHTRGAQTLQETRHPLPRIIPAYAGSTKPIAAVEHSRTDHPRIRGEHRPCGGPSAGPRGSSPHTRGARRDPPGHRRRRRIIPAYAGSTSGVGYGFVGVTDHPRIRGEHWGGPARLST